jgi:hypothetical protein
VSTAPSFAGATTASSLDQNTCGVTVSWAPGLLQLPAHSNLRYNIFRGTVPDFVPSPANRIATCVVGPSSYVDTDNLASGTTYYYVVRAEIRPAGNGGECGRRQRGIEHASASSATPYAAGMQNTPGTWMDGGGDGTVLIAPGHSLWRVVKTSDDPGANHTRAAATPIAVPAPAPARRMLRSPARSSRRRL